MFVVVDYSETGNTVAYDRHVFKTRSAAEISARDLDTRSATGQDPVEKWDEQADGPVTAPGQVIYH